MAGFSLVELLVVMGITIFLATVLLLNFRTAASNKVARHQISSLIVADLRLAQGRAASGTRYQERVICGYGLYQLDRTNYIIYVDAPTGSNSCGNNRNYQSGQDFIVETRTVGNINFEIYGLTGPGSKFLDVFFEAPGPKTYLNDNALLDSGIAVINVVNTGQNCGASNCTTITVNKAGNINITN